MNDKTILRLALLLSTLGLMAAFFALPPLAVAVAILRNEHRIHTTKRK